MPQKSRNRSISGDGKQGLATIAGAAEGDAVDNARLLGGPIMARARCDNPSSWCISSIHCSFSAAKNL